MDYINSDNFDFEMNPKIALDALKTSHAMARVSVGLPATGPATQGSRGSNGNGNDTTHYGGPPSIEMEIRKVARTHRRTIHQASHLEQNDLLGEFLITEEVAEAMQELVLKVNPPEAEAAVKERLLQDD